MHRRRAIGGRCFARRSHLGRFSVHTRDTRTSRRRRDSRSQGTNEKNGQNLFGPPTTTRDGAERDDARRYRRLVYIHYITASRTVQQSTACSPCGSSRRSAFLCEKSLSNTRETHRDDATTSFASSSTQRNARGSLSLRTSARRTIVASSGDTPTTAAIFDSPVAASTYSTQSYGWTTATASRESAARERTRARSVRRRLARTGNAATRGDDATRIERREVSNERPSNRQTDRGDDQKKGLVTNTTKL